MVFGLGVGDERPSSSMISNDRQGGLLRKLQPGTLWGELRTINDQIAHYFTWLSHSRSIRPWLALFSICFSLTRVRPFGLGRHACQSGRARAGSGEMPGKRRASTCPG